MCAESQPVVALNAGMAVGYSFEGRFFFRFDKIDFAFFSLVLTVFL